MQKKSSLIDKIVTCGIFCAIFIILKVLISAGINANQLGGFLVPLCYYIILAVSLNLVVGISGELSLGHAGFICIGAFAGSAFSVIMQEVIPQSLVRIPLAMLVGGLTAGLFGFVIGIPVLRLRGDYLAIVTLAFGEIIKNVVQSIYIGYNDKGIFVTLFSNTKGIMDWKIKSGSGNYTELIKGPNGIVGTPNDLEDNVFFILCFAAALITIIVLLNLVDSKLGRNIKAARDNRIAAEAMGINVTGTKLVAFVTASFFAGVAGVIYSHYYSYQLQAVKFDYNLSIMILVYVVLGGMSKMRGVMIATVLLYILPEYLRFLRDYRMLLYAVVLIAMMLLKNNEHVKVFSARVSASVKGTFKKDKKTAEITENGGKN